MLLVPTYGGVRYTNATPGGPAGDVVVNVEASTAWGPGNNR